MTSAMVSAGTIGYAVAACAHLALAAYLLRAGFLRAAPAAVPRLFLAAVVITALWATSAAADQVQVGWGRGAASALLDLLRYALWGATLLLLVRPAPGAQPRGLFRLLTGIAVALLGGGLWVIALGFDAGRLDVGALAASSLAWAVYALLLLEQLLRNQPESSRWNAKPVVLALGLCFAFDVYVFAETVLFASFDEDALAARGMVYALATPLLLVATRRDALWVGKIQVSRTAAFYSATLLLAGAYLLFIAGVGYYVRVFGGSWGRALQMATLFAALMLLAVVLVSGTLRSRLRVFLGKNFFSYRYDYREEWLRFTALLSTRATPQEVGATVVKGLADLVECPAGGLWMRGLGESTLAQAARWNMPESNEREPADSAFCRLLVEREWIVDLEEFRSNPKAYGDAVLPLWLATSPTAWLVVPLIVGEELAGFVVLSRPRTAVDANWEVRDLLKTAARQAAGFLAQMHATEALLEARKFDAFNRMSAFVVHDLKNIVTQLSLMLKNAERHRDNPEFQQDMLLTVQSSLEKMRQMMAQLREGEKPVAGSVSGVDLVAAIESIARQAAQRGRTLEVEIVDRVATRGHPQRIERVLGHLVQNAFDATPASGRVWVRLRQDAGRAEVVIGDTGSGMSPEFIRTQLFRPFSSTKGAGMGIGTYESQQYVKELGGRLEVRSEPGRGTELTILLPLFDLRTGSDLKAAAAG